MILVDTTVWIDFFNDNETEQVLLLERYLVSELILVGDLILAEVLQGFKSDKDYSIAKSELDNFLFVEMVGKKIAHESSNNYRYLRKKGITIRKTIDVIIGSFCIYNNISLLHNDRDFDPMEKYLNLMVVRD